MLWAQQAGPVRFVVEMPERLQDQILRGYFMMGFLCGVVAVLVALALFGRKNTGGDQ